MSIKLQSSSSSELLIEHTYGQPARSISTRDISYTVDTVADMEALIVGTASKYEKHVCFVRDANRGGSFVFYEAEIANDNQGTNFSGWVRQYSGAVNVKWFATIQLGIDYCTTNNKIAFCNTVETITSKIVISSSCDFSSAIFNVSGSPTVAIEVSTGSAANPLDLLIDKNISLPTVINTDKPAIGWVGQGIGVRVVNANNCKIVFNRIAQFAINLQIISYSRGTVYNNFYLGALLNGKVNLNLACGDAGGWTNENIFYGGGFQYESAEGISVAGTRHILIDKCANPINNNLFIKPSIEGNVPEYHLECGGSTNTFQQVRFESTTPKVRYTADNVNQGTYNIILCGYQTSGIVFSYDSALSSFANQVIGAKANNYINGSSVDGINKYRNTASSAYPVDAYYEAAVKPETASTTEWSMSHGAQGLKGKRMEDSYERIKVDYVNGRLHLGGGTLATDTYIARYGTLGMSIFGAFLPSTDDTRTLGLATNRWSSMYATTYYGGAGVAGVTGTFVSPTSITVNGGIVTAVV